MAQNGQMHHAVHALIENYAAQQRALSEARSCQHCRWVHMYPDKSAGIWMVCTHPRTCRGQAARNTSCCSFEREPGTDDDLPA